ncbi:MAG TPA: DUF2076 domain-containing protein [Beijerinckiaceae bacterium]
MNDQERQIIADVFKRLEQVAHQPRDPEAERFIADQVRQQPYAPYAMAQAIVVQEEALKNLNAQVQQLHAELERQRAQGSSSGGFLSSLFGGGSRPEPRPEYRQDPRQAAGGPWGQPQGGYGQQQPGYGQPQGMGMQPGMQPGMMGGQPGMMGGMPQRQGSGFLGTAMATAAGVAGGVMLGSALSNAFGGAGGAAGGLFGGGAEGAAAGGSGFGDLSPFGTAGTPTPAADQGGGFDQGGADFHDASFDNADFGSDSGGDDWA